MDTKENVLALVRSEKKQHCELYAKNIFFKMYNQERLANRGLVNPRYKTDLQGLLIRMDRCNQQNPITKEENNAIVTIFRTLESMWHFYVTNQLPKELNKLIVTNWLQSASQFEQEPNPHPSFNC